MPGEVYEDGKVHVRAKQCANCLLSKDRLVPGQRARQLIEETRSNVGGSFICHKGQVSEEHTSICRAWWDRYAQEDPILRLAVAVDIVKEVDDV